MVLSCVILLKKTINKIKSKIKNQESETKYSREIYLFNELEQIDKAAKINLIIIIHQP